MCGLLGFSKVTEATRRMLPVLALRMEARGTDSWGVTDGVTIHKHLGAISDSWEDPGFTGEVLYHTRAASTGAVTVDNAHPFKFYTDKKTVVGAHNGIVTNHYALKTKYKRDKVEVDSQHIFMHLAEDKPVEEIDGWGAVIWWEYPTDKPEQRKLYFSKFSSQYLHIALLDTPDNEFVFASTQEAITDAARFANVKIGFNYIIESNIKYTIEDGNLVEVGKLNWEATPVEYVHTGTSRGLPLYGGQRRDMYDRYPSGSFYNPNRLGKRVTVCATKKCSNNITAQQFLCDDCLKPMQEEYLQAGA